MSSGSGMDEFKGSPYRRHRNDDLESGNTQRKRGHSGDHGGGGPLDICICRPFDIVRTKSATVDSLKRWRVSFLILSLPLYDFASISVVIGTLLFCSLFEFCCIQRLKLNGTRKPVFYVGILSIFLWRLF